MVADADDDAEDSAAVVEAEDNTGVDIAVRNTGIGTERFFVRVG